MKKPGHIEVLLLLGLFFVLVFSQLPVVYTLLYHDLTGMPTAERGSIDLSKTSSKRRIILDGQWEFYWNRLIVTDPKQSAAPDFLIHVPDYWSKYQVDGSYLPADGFASYRLTLKRLNASAPVTIYLPDFGSAYRVYLDGRLTAESGVVSENAAKVFTTTSATLYPQTLSEGQEHEVIIETATTRFSGLYMAPVMMDYGSAIQGDSVRNSVRLILFGIALSSTFVLIAGYILSFQLGRRSVWLPVVGSLVLLRIMMTTEFYSMWQNTLFACLSYEETNPLLFLLTFVLKYLLIFLFEELLGILFSRREKLCFLLYYTDLYLVYLFIPQGIYNRHLTVLLPACAFAIEAYSFFKFYRNRRQVKKYGLPVYWGACLAILGLIVDCYYEDGNIYLNLSLASLVSFTAYLIILGLISSIHVSEVSRDFAVSSTRLSQARAQIDMQTEYYSVLSEQMNEVRSIRHDMRHFIGTLKRLSDEGRYPELGRFLNEYAEKADMDPIPVFCENIVVNSILGYYALRMKEHGVTFQCACQIPEQLPVSDGDLCIILGNALENALEACEKLESPETRSVSAEIRSVNRQLLIKIVNAYGGTLNPRDSHYLTTKGSPGHGMGLKNIQKVANFYGGFVKAEHSAAVFTLMVAFPMPQDDASGTSR